MSNTPPVVLVHGAWHGAWCWAHLQAALDARGIPSYAVDLPGHGASTEPLADLYADARLVAEVIARVGDHAGTSAVLVGHSYGGAVITEAANRAIAAGHPLAHLVYLTAFVLDEGESLMALYGAMPRVETLLAAAMEPGDAGSTVLRNRELATAALYGCCDPALVDAALDRLSPQPMITFSQPASGAPWKTVASTYVQCLRDQAIHLAHQRHMAARCASVVSLDTDHSPFISKVTETADLLESIVRQSSRVVTSS